MSGSYFCAIIDHDHAPLFLRQFLNPSKVEEYLQLVEKTQGVEFRFCNLILGDRDEVTLPVGVWFMLTMKHFCAHMCLVMSVIKT